jgi:hypothetical protein
MDRNRINYGEMIAGVSAILLSYFMFFDWFGSKDSGELQLFSVGRNAWEALDYIPIILMIAIVAALVAPTLRLTKLVYRAPLPINAIVGVLGIVSVLLILYRIVEPPNFGSLTDTFGTVPIEGTVQFPIFLALAAAVGIAFGGYWALRDEGTVRSS